MTRALPVPSLPAGATSTTGCRRLDSGWELARSAPGAVETAVALAADTTLDWHGATVPGTVAAAIGPEGPDGLDEHEHYDASDWWYRTRFAGPATAGARAVLRFDGLATLATVWLNGTEILSSTNMFVRHRIEVSDLLTAGDNDLVIVFRSLEAALGERRPRPRWKTRLVENQRLRWFRTTLLGRIPGWTPRIEPVGPWREIVLETPGDVDVSRVTLRTDLNGSDGSVEVSSSIRLGPDARLDGARLRVEDQTCDLEIEHGDGMAAVGGHVAVPDVAAWWPHTHGRPKLYRIALELDVDGRTTVVDCGRRGFRTVRVDREGGRIGFEVNGIPVFCRGACWTSNDIVSLVGNEDELERTLRLVAEANGNMIRVGGTMVYEVDAFYRLCDELGIMVWQDFMFANMDYPLDDPDFVSSVHEEVTQELGRLGAHPSVVAFCGGSEVQQQAAMFGAAPEAWAHDFFTDRLAGTVEALAPGLPYWSSTPTGGTLPFHVDEGLGHYYGVGAYRRPLDDARTAAVKFTPECLGFSNVPEPGNARLLLGDGAPPTHHPTWKAGVPRDSGAGWDFEDIRDHYLEQLYGVDPVELRSADLPRYHRLSRQVTGQVMSAVFDEWRSPDHPCGGGLVWFLRDLRPGAGWGLIDSENRPKPAWHFLRRAWAPVRIALLDRGVNGLRVEIHNETDAPVDGTLRVRLFSESSRLLTQGERTISVPARATAVEAVEALLGHFADPTYAYRFGPLGHAAVVATLEGAGAPATPTVFWPALDRELPAADLDGSLAPDHLAGELRATGLARAIRLDLGNGYATESYLDLVPDEPIAFELREAGEGGAVWADAENAPHGVRLRTPAPDTT